MCFSLIFRWKTHLTNINFLIVYSKAAGVAATGKLRHSGQRAATISKFYFIACLLHCAGYSCICLLLLTWYGAQAMPVSDWKLLLPLLLLSVVVCLFVCLFVVAFTFLVSIQLVNITKSKQTNGRSDRGIGQWKRHRSREPKCSLQLLLLLLLKLGWNL